MRVTHVSVYNLQRRSHKGKPSTNEVVVILSIILHINTNSFDKTIQTADFPDDCNSFLISAIFCDMKSAVSRLCERIPVTRSVKVFSNIVQCVCICIVV